MRLIETTHLKTWAGSKIAESRFPYIIKSLILAVIEPEKLRMPSGDDIWLPGYDGVVTNSVNDRFVPLGMSIWEVSTDTKIRSKADRDYEKRSFDKKVGKKQGKSSIEIDRSNITFVFSTPRVWKDKDKWVEKRKAEGIWFDVRVIDAADLKEWFEVALAVNLQFAAEIGLVPEEGLHTPDHAWEEWSHYTDPPVSEDLVVTGREEQEKELIRRLTMPHSIFTIRGDSPREAWGFALAAIYRICLENDRQNILSRLIIADNEKIASRLRHLKNLIVILKRVEDQVPNTLASRSGCHVVVPEGNDAHSERNVIVLGRSTYSQFAEALKRMGLYEEEAERESRACGLSVTILQRLRAHATFQKPSWAEGGAVTNLLPALLAGRWSDGSRADQQILCQLAGVTDYAIVQSQLQLFLVIDEPPLLKIGEMWSLTAPVDAFQLTARYLTESILERFKIAFREVFGRIDPKVEISPDEWITYDLKGERGHSGWLRSGMAETLLLISERGKDARMSFIHSPRSYTEEVVRGIPCLNDDWRILASLRDQYARLMEAAPDPFLNNIEQLIEEKPDDIKKLFVEGEGIFGGGSMHTGLLWGLETMIWSPEYLPRVALILAKLACLDPGGRIVNRPINSLREIFLWWHPGTNATIDEKLAAIDLVLVQEPNTGWALLANLLPASSHSTSHPTSRPRWRDIGELPTEVRSRSGEIKYLSGIVDRALDHVGNDPERWQVILRSLRFIGSILQEKALNLLRSIVQGQMAEEKRKALWEKLRNYINEHRAFRNADWAVSEDLLKKMDEILSFVVPEDPVERNRWLFDEWLPDLPSKRKEIDQNEKQVEELRQQAIQEILRTQGIEGLIKLGTTCKLPGFVASIAVSMLGDIGKVCDFINHAIVAGEPGVYFAGHISGQALGLYGQAWRDFICKEARDRTWHVDVVATLIILWPDEKSTWEEVTSLGVEVEKEYWRRKYIRLIDGSPSEKAYQIDHLIEAGRATQAFDRIALHMKGIPTETLVKLFDAAFSELEKAETIEEIRRLGMNAHDTNRFLDELRTREDLKREELARREYKALPILGSLDAKGLTIHEFMAEDPVFFVDVLCTVFLPASREKSKDTEPTTEEQVKAQAAYRLLNGMHQIPGMGKDGNIDEAALFQWIHAVRKKAAELDRVAVADLHIGSILAHASIDPKDGAWPHRVIRNVIEKFRSVDIDRGLIIERYNMRGTVSKALYEGGAQERALAGQYRIWAQISSMRWHRTAQVLNSMAQSWEEDAHKEDDRAEQQKIE